MKKLCLILASIFLFASLVYAEGSIEIYKPDSFGGMNRSCFGYRAGYDLTTQDNVVIIGAFSDSCCSNTVVIGTGIKATKPNQIIIGTKDFSVSGEISNEDVKYIRDQLTEVVREWLGTTE